MSHWNRAYLDALEVPVWVPLCDQAGQESPQEHEHKESPQPIADDVTSDYYFQLVSGNLNAALLFVVPDEVEGVVISETLKQLEFAWRCWTEQPFSAAVLQRTSSKDNFVDLEKLKGMLINCCPETEQLELPATPAPVFDLKQASKKDWWLLLQRLYQ
jgi:hypothetical protein